MFQFRKKPKPLPVTVVRRQKTSSAKKSEGKKSTSLKRDMNTKQESIGFFGAYSFLWILFLSVAAYTLIFSPFLKIEIIRVEGSVDVPVADIEGVVHGDIAGKYFGFIPKDTLLMLMKHRIESDVKNRFKKIKTVEVTRTFPNMITVRIEERKTLVVWCSADNCFSIDEDGYAYAPIDPSQRNSYRKGVLVITDESAQAVDADDPVLDPDFVHFSTDVQEKLQQGLSMEVSAECSTPSRFSDELDLQTQEGWRLFLNVREPLNDSAYTLQLLLKKEISEERRHRLKYIDLRTKNRAYYSVEGETVSAPSDPNAVPTEPPLIVAPADVNPIKKERSK